ncbi:DNA-binding transcriptional response regulator [Stigmatella hybrida]|uniref:response regulator n=1 Tax=Stigmatella hybrida TaxID=394097 RepID=UPI001CDAD0F3|nr:response regulator [Stigmatella hybrida]
MRGMTLRTEVSNLCSVLFVAAEEAVLGTAGAILSMHFQVKLATAAEPAIALMDQHHFDVACVDIDMPPRDCGHLLHAASTSRPYMAGILITGDYQSVLRLELQQTRDHFHLLRKPYRPQELTTLIHRAATAAKLKRMAHRLRREPAPPEARMGAGGGPP